MNRTGTSHTPTNNLDENLGSTHKINLPKYNSPLSKEDQLDVLLARVYPEKNKRRGDEIEILKKVLSIPTEESHNLDRKQKFVAALVCKEAANILSGEVHQSRINSPVQIVNNKPAFLSGYPREEGDPYFILLPILSVPYDSGFTESVYSTLSQRADEFASEIRRELTKTTIKKIHKNFNSSEDEKTLNTFNKRIQTKLTEDHDEFRVMAPRTKGHFSISTLNCLASLLHRKCTLPLNSRKKIVADIINGDLQELSKEVGALVRRIGYRAQIANELAPENNAYTPIDRTAVKSFVHLLSQNDPTENDKALIKILERGEKRIAEGVNDKELTNEVKALLEPLPTDIETIAFLEPWLLSRSKITLDELHGLLVLTKYGPSKTKECVPRPEVFSGTTGESLGMLNGPKIEIGLFHDETIAIAAELLKNDPNWKDDPRRPQPKKRFASIYEIQNLSGDELKKLEEKTIEPDPDEVHMPAAIGIALRKLGFSTAYIEPLWNDNADFGPSWQIYLGPNILSAN